MKFNWIDFVIIFLLFLSFFAGLKKSLFTGIINLIVSCFIIGFVLVCLNSIRLSDSLTVYFRESCLVVKFLNAFSSLNIGKLKLGRRIS